MKVWIRGGTQLAALAFVASLSGVAHAVDAKGCFTPVGGINGADPDIHYIANGSYGGQFDERWNGSFGYGWQTGSLGEDEFKAVSDGNTIFVSWRHLILKNEIAGYEGVQVGFGYTPNGSSNQVSQIIRVMFGALPDDLLNTPLQPDPNEGRVSVTTNITAKPAPSCTGTANVDVTRLLQSLAPILIAHGDLAQDVNTFLNSLCIQCADLNAFLKAVGGLNWGPWNSWVQLLISQITSASGCHC